VTMTGATEKNKLSNVVMEVRMEMIRERHQALILGPRELLGDGADMGFDDAFDIPGEDDHAELAEMLGAAF
jgi:hypothetical protein